MDRSKTISEAARILAKISYDQLEAKDLLKEGIKQVLVNALYLAMLAPEEVILQAKLKIVGSDWPSPNIERKTKRPPITKVQEVKSISPKIRTVAAARVEDPPKRKRGRPPKVRV